MKRIIRQLQGEKNDKMTKRLRSTNRSPQKCQYQNLSQHKKLQDNNKHHHLYLQKKPKQREKKYGENSQDHNEMDIMRYRSYVPNFLFSPTPYIYLVFSCSPFAPSPSPFFSFFVEPTPLAYHL